MIIDCHTHPCFDSRLFKRIAEDNGIEFSTSGLKNEMKTNGVSMALAFASFLKDFHLSNEAVIDLAENDGKIVPIGSIDPDSKEIGDLEELLKKKRVKGLKIYSGYWPFGPNEPFLEEAYDLCERYGVPAIFHTGDTVTSYGKLKYSLPILIDEIATRHRKLKMVLCHFGNPWIMEAAEILYKNPNVLSDLSGLVAGRDAKYTPKYIESIRASIMEAISFVGEVEGKLLFGSDWPIGRIDQSLQFVRSLGLDEKDEAAVLGGNAKKLFGV